MAQWVSGIQVARGMMLQDQLFAYGILLAASSLLIVLAETPLAVIFAQRPALQVIILGSALVGLGFLAFSPARVAATEAG
jgi:hypothetical protein